MASHLTGPTLPRAKPPGDDVTDILLVTSHCATAQDLADALKRTGATVTQIDGATFSDRAKAHAAFQRDKRADAIVIISLPPPASRKVTALNDMDEPNWVAATDAPMRGMLYTLQGARQHFAGGRGAVICVGPDVGLSGAPGCASLATLAEGQRGMMKSTARQWANQGVIINWISVATPVLAPDLADAPFPELPELGPDIPATGTAPDIDQLAETIAYLAGPGARAHCGASFNLDGGRWMLP